MDDIDRCYGTVLCNGLVCSVTNLFDLDGDDTDDLDLASSAICRHPDGWISFDLIGVGLTRPS